MVKTHETNWLPRLAFRNWYTGDVSLPFTLILSISMPSKPCVGRDTLSMTMRWRMMLPWHMELAGGVAGSCS